MHFDPLLDTSLHCESRPTNTTLITTDVWLVACGVYVFVLF